jgi:hypothetical protein
LSTPQEIEGLTADGIPARDHADGIASSLANLARYLQARRCMKPAPGGYHIIIGTEQGEDEWLTAP